MWQPFGLLLVIEASLALVSLGCLALVFTQPRNYHLRLVALLGLLPVIAMTVLFPAMWEFYKLPVFVTTLLWHSRTLAPTSALALAIMIYSEANGSVHVSPYWYILLVGLSSLVFLPAHYVTTGFVQVVIYATLMARLRSAGLGDRGALYFSALTFLIASALYVVMEQFPWQLSFVFSMVLGAFGLTHYRLYEILQLVALLLLLRHFVCKGQDQPNEGVPVDVDPKTQ